MTEQRLEGRPEARSFTVEGLLTLVREGKLRLPEFQRPLRWRSSHVVDLFDSIYRGFPVGTLLFSKGPADARLLHFGPLSVEAREAGDAYFVVDGQQRITALAGALLHPDRSPRGDIHAVWFDLDAEKFARASRAEPPAHWIPLNVLGSPRGAGVLKWLNDWPLRNERPDLVDRAMDLSSSIRGYQIPAYIVEGASKEALQRIFKRVNTSGVAMREVEIFEALFTAGPPQPVQAACARLRGETGFGEVSTDLFLRCLRAVEGLNTRRPFSEREDDAAGLDAGAVERTEMALRRAIGFITEDAGVPHIKLLPYQLPFNILPSFFHMHPDPAPRARALLVRWLWRGALSGVHSDNSNATVQSLLSQIDVDAYASIERLLGTVPARCEFPSSSTGWYGQSAKAILCALAMVHLGPRDPESGEALSIQEIQMLLDERRMGKVFPDVTRGSRSIVGRRVLLSDRDRIRKLTQATPEALRSLALDRDAVEMLSRRDFAAFDQRRAALLDRWLIRFFSERCALGEIDRPPIGELLRRVEQKAAAG